MSTRGIYRLAHRKTGSVASNFSGHSNLLDAYASNSQKPKLTAHTTHMATIITAAAVLVG